LTHCSLRKPSFCVVDELKQKLKQKLKITKALAFPGHAPQYLYNGYVMYDW